MLPLMGDRDRDEETGQFTIEFTDQEFIEAIQDLDKSASTSEVANKLGCDRRTAYLRLKKLEDGDRISSRKVGNSLLWTIE